jgi:putative (di)nucleoside polyphosphate hydrolase
MALTELSRFLPRYENRNRYWRGSLRSQEGHSDMHMEFSMSSSHLRMELPPGASFDPDPQRELNEQETPRPAPPL